MIPMGNFEEWEWLYEWVQNNDEYEYAGNGNPENMFDNLEEHFCYAKCPGFESLRVQKSISFEAACLKAGAFSCSYNANPYQW